MNPFFRYNLILFTGLLASTMSLVAGQTRPSYHITPDVKWLNDPQRPFYLASEWNLYYLWNSEWDASNPGAGGTEWYHVTSSDMVHWTAQNVAIPKYQPNHPGGPILGDIQTGSSVVDTANTAGFGSNAVIAMLTQMANGVQQQSLFYSTDSGNSFTAFESNPVMPNPSPDTKPAFRDPKIIWDDEAGQWVTALAEGDKVTFFASDDLKSWTYMSFFSPVDAGVDLGVLECPDLYQMDLDGDEAKRSWILAVGANGYLHGRTTGTVYWSGTWDGTDFTAATTFPQWMDEGPDFYASVSWENPDDKYGSRYAIGWMNNWEYADTLPYFDGFQGQQSLVREVRYRTVNGVPKLISVPIAGVAALFASPVSVEGTVISTDPSTASLPANLAGGAYVIHAEVSKADGDDGDEVLLRIKRRGDYGTTIGYSFAESHLFLVRDADGSATDGLASEPKQVWDAIRIAPNPTGGNTIKLSIYVDWNSVEAFANDGISVLSALIYPNQGAEGIEVVTQSGTLSLDSFAYAGLET